MDWGEKMSKARKLDISAFGDLTIARTVGRTYPAWLNAVAWPVLLLVPVGLIILFVGYSSVGLAFLFIGFMGIWIFGNLAATLGRDVRRYRDHRFDIGCGPP